MHVKGCINQIQQSNQARHNIITREAQLSQLAQGSLLQKLQYSECAKEETIYSLKNIPLGS